jgi:S1-C subfamily serine protease
VDRLKPILGDMLERGRSAGPPHPWLGMAAQELHGRLMVTRVTEGGPADKAGIRPGDLVLGVGGEAVDGLDGFYRKVWAVGAAGVAVPLNVLQGIRVEPILVHSVDRYDFLRLGRSY